MLRYSFPAPHPFNSGRATRFWEDLAKSGLAVTLVPPEKADDDLVELFHAKEHVEFVRKASTLGYGDLDEGDTPAFPGILDAAEFVVGSTLSLVDNVLAGKIDHGFNPVGGLHHASRTSSAGFCVFNDVGVAIEFLRRRGQERILYVDVDAHHGDGVYYAFEEDPGVFIFDVHEDGRFLYPGTGSSEERGKGRAEGTKVNIPLPRGADDRDIEQLLPRLEEFAQNSRADFIIFQCGADGMAGDPLGELHYSEKVHGNVAALLHRISHQRSGGRLIALGGGGYSPENCSRAWIEVVRELAKG